MTYDFTDGKDRTELWLKDEPEKRLSIETRLEASRIDKFDNFVTEAIRLEVNPLTVAGWALMTIALITGYVGWYYTGYYVEVGHVQQQIQENRFQRINELDKAIRDNDKAIRKLAIELKEDEIILNVALSNKKIRQGDKFICMKP